MPKPRALTPAEEQAAYAKFRDCMGARGAIALLAREYGLTWVGMKGVLDRVSGVTNSEGSRGTLARAGICSVCQVTHDRRRSDGRPSSYCQACHNSYNRRTRPKYSDLSPEQKLKSNARAMANVYERRGKLIRQPCADCGGADVQKHHDDYTKPLEVTWLCRPCHMARHPDELMGKHKPTAELLARTQ